MFKTITATLILSSAIAAFAQAVPPPTVPQQIIYHHWPEQFVQWIGPELPYSMFVLYVDANATGGPLYQVMFTERTTDKRVYYTNRQQPGEDAFVTNIQFDRPAHPGKDATYLLRFVDHSGQPVSWQFVQGSDMSERGGGSSPAGLQPPVLVYREQGAVAGEGTALKIGNTVSTADVWTEISQPPYFVAYHGAYSQNVDIAVFIGAPQQWTTVSSPNSLAVGAEWALKAQDGTNRTLKIDTLSGSHATISDAANHLVMEGDFSNGAWSISKLHYAGAGADGLTITLANAKFEVVAGKKTRIADGAVQPDGWQFKDPAWLKGKTVR
jgi:hypothetical protein